MSNKVLIAAAGRGTRMLDLARNRPKHLIHVAGQPFLYYLLNNLKQAGLTEMIIVIGYKPEIMAEFLDAYKNEFNITVVNQFDKLGEDKYGTACPLWAAREFLADQKFVSVYGDNLYDVADLRALNNDDEHCYIAGLEHDQPENYGVLSVGPDGLLQGIIEKPKVAPSRLINTGLYKFTPEIFQALDKIELSLRGEYELTDAVDRLAKQGKVKARQLTGVWLDFGKPSDISKVEDYINNAKKNY